MLTALAAASGFDGKRPVAFERVVISTNRFEAASLFDVNRDGHPDIFCGDAWYAGPGFTARGETGPVQVFNDYHEDFAALPMDVNGDGYLDVITGGWFTGKVRWRENPQGDPSKPWREFILADVGPVETLLAWDLDGDGRREVIANTPGSPQRVLRQKADAEGRTLPEFERLTINEHALGHGLGCGDLNADGLPDIVFASCWLENPGGALGATSWIQHVDFNLGSASVPILVVDVNGDGRSDLIVGQGHAYGLDWWEQTTDVGRKRWRKHSIDPFSSQYHFLVWQDIDRDGNPELITGKRRHAHRDKDPGDADPAGLYYFKWTGDGFAKIVIDYGVGSAGKGCGIYFEVADVTGDGWPDVIAPGKDGLNLYKSLSHLNPK